MGEEEMRKKGEDWELKRTRETGREYRLGSWMSQLLCVLSDLSHVQCCVTLCPVANQAPRSAWFSKQEHWSRCHSLLGIFPTKRLNPHLHLLHWPKALTTSTNSGKPQRWSVPLDSVRVAMHTKARLRPCSGRERTLSCPLSPWGKASPWGTDYHVRLVASLTFADAPQGNQRHSSSGRPSAWLCDLSPWGGPASRCEVVKECSSKWAQWHPSCFYSHSDRKTTCICESREVIKQN